jgi:hypothetical protein
MFWPSITVVYCGYWFSRSSTERQSNSVRHFSTRLCTQSTPTPYVDPEPGISLARIVRSSRSLRSSIWACGTSTRKGLMSALVMTDSSVEGNGILRSVIDPD